MEEQKLELKVENLTLGELTTNALKIKEEIKNKLEEYKAENYDINSIDKAKEDKAMLNRTAKKLNDERIKLEKEFMKPFDEFKVVVKEITEMIKDSSSKIDEIVKEVENKDKEEKKKAILVIFESEVKELKDVLKFEKVFDERYLNKTFKIEDVEKDLISKLDKIRNDLITISELHSKYEIELKNDYLNNFDLGMVIRKNSELTQREEALKNQVEETKKVIEEQKEEKVQEIVKKVIEIRDTKEPKKLLTYRLDITGDEDQQRALKRFLDTTGMSYEKVK